MEEGIEQVADAGAVETPVETVESAPVVSEPVADASVSEPDEFADLYEKVDEEPVKTETPAVLSGDAPLYMTSEYVKTPEQAVQAVQAATEVWDVQTGKKDAGEFLDAMRQTNPERYQTAVGEMLAAVKWAGENGHLDLAKLGITFGQVGPNALKEDPTVAALRSEVMQMKTAEQQRTEASQRAQQDQVIAKTKQAISGVFAEVSKGKWYEGDAEFGDSILAQMDKNGVDAKLSQTNMAEWRKGYERAAKQVHNAELNRIATRSKAVIAHQQRLRASTPATPGQEGGAVSGKAKSGSLDRASYPEGPDGLRQWQSAQMAANGWTE